MSGQEGQAPAADEAARLEKALARIARAASRHDPRQATASNGQAGALQDTAQHATTRPGPNTAEIAARLDGLIAELRTLLHGPDT